MRSLVLFGGLLAAAAGSQAATVTVLDATGDVGSSPALAIGADGRGLVAYYDATNADLKVAHCQLRLAAHLQTALRRPANERKVHYDEASGRP